MDNQGATPAQAATPPSGAPVVTPGSPAAANSQGTTQQPVGATVTISAQEYADLQRAKGRTLGFDRKFQKPAPVAQKIDPATDPTGALAAAEAARIAAEQRALQLEVKGQVRDLLADPRFTNIPASTKQLILEAPHMITTAETLEEAMYDIEDKLLDLVGKDTTIPVTVVVPGQVRETPPVVTPGAPAPVDAGTMIDTTNLRGPARSQGVLKNAMTKAKSGQK